jgi:hypothetical protein
LKPLEQVGLQRSRLELLEARLGDEETPQRGIALPDRAPGILGEGEARKDLEEPARVLEGQEARHAEIPGGQRVAPRPIVRHCRLPELLLHVVLAPRGRTGEQQRERRDAAPCSPKRRSHRMLNGHGARSPYPTSKLRTN